MNQQFPSHGTWRLYAGLSAVSAAGLIFQIVLTRIFSVTMGYHFAFLAVSLAMAGMAIGSLLVYLLPSLFPAERTLERLSQFAMLASVTMIVAILQHLVLPLSMGFSLLPLYALFTSIILLTLPFVAGGICVSLCLSRFSAFVSSLYAIDLAGAALGCLLTAYMLSVSDGPISACFASLLCAIAALLFMPARGRAALLWTVGLGLFTMFGVYRITTGMRSVLPISWIRGELQHTPLFERWNGFSRVAVEEMDSVPFGWGLSRTIPPDFRIEQKYLTIDANASTPLTKFDTHDFAALKHLSYDVTNLVYYLKRDARVLVLGSGGGRDILSALASGAQGVIGVEMNSQILSATNHYFGDFTGHIDRIPKVSIFNDEARSFVAQQTSRFDVLQLSLIDTFSAASTGAYALTENSLYTIEAWKSFLSVLTERGIFSVSRWYFRSHPYEALRTMALAGAALRSLGIGNPEAHLIAVYNPQPSYRAGDDIGVLSILISRSPFLPEEVARIKELSQQLRFETILLPPPDTSEPLFLAAATALDFKELNDTLHRNITPPTDDAPFFFNTLRLRDALTGYIGDFTEDGPIIYLVLMIAVLCLLSFGAFRLPYWLGAKRSASLGNASFLGFFGCIGLGYMTIEIAQMQRFSVFLGHPIYGITVVLVSLLLGTGIGSLLTRGRTENPILWISAVCFGTALLGICTPPILGSFRGSPQVIRLLLASIILLANGVLLGISFPTGLKALRNYRPEIIPWCWGVNGATSILGGGLGIAGSIFLGISFTYWMGVSCYLGALLAAFSFAKKEAGKIPSGLSTCA